MHSGAIASPADILPNVEPEDSMLPLLLARSAIRSSRPEPVPKGCRAGRGAERAERAERDEASRHLENPSLAEFTAVTENSLAPASLSFDKIVDNVNYGEPAMRRMPGWVKRADRQAAYVGASVRLSDGRKVPVVITDVSSDGCKLSCRRMLPIGETVELSVPGKATFKASVRWWSPGKAGLLFTGVSPDLTPAACEPANDERASAPGPALQEPS